MSEKQTVNEDKKDIEREERETMLNEVNKVQDAPIIEPEVKEISKLNKDDIKEGREVKPKKIPIGGIQMPGFFTRSKSKEKCKDGETEQIDDTEDIELLEEGTHKNEEDKVTRIKLPFAKKNKPENTSEGEKPSEGGQRKSLIDSIRFPLVSVFPKKSKTQDSQTLGMQGGAAGLASMETLDDDKSNDKIDGDMKEVKLDVDEKTPAEKQEITEGETNCATKLRSYRVVITALLLFLLAIIVILCLIIPGHQVPVMPLRDGKYILAVTQCGLVEGLKEESSYAFRGIPYAQPPINNLRWKPAQPLNLIEHCWKGTFQAYNNTEKCPQINADGLIEGEEDCLTLDIVTPYVRYDTPLPVIVMIGTETLMGGTPSRLRPSPRYARSQDVVFVRPNFRLGALGFLALRELSMNSTSHVSGNYGLSDIIEVLKWVQRNIPNFGGDPNVVTLFGHQAGATLVTALTTMRNASGLFARAWASSGSAIYPGKELAESEKNNRGYLDAVGCGNFSCLLTKEPDYLTEAVLDTWRKPVADLPAASEDPNNRHEWLVLDLVILRKNPVKVWSENPLPVKLMLGATAHSAASNFLLDQHLQWTPELVKKHIQESFLGKMNLTDEVLSRYAATYQGLVALVSDIRVVCPIYANSIQHSGKVPFYVVTQTRGDQEIADVNSDVDAILGRYEPITTQQRHYVAAMQQLFYHFVWHGEISQVGARNKVLVVGQDVNPAANYSHCDFWISKDVVPKYAQLD